VVLAAKCDGGAAAAMLATDRQNDIRPPSPTAFCAKGNQLSHTFDIKRVKRDFGIDALLDVR
jgi:hypothetical protein